MVERAATIAHSPDGFLALWKELALSASVPPTPLEQGDVADSPGPSQPSMEQMVKRAHYYANRGEFGKAWAAFSPSAPADGRDPKVVANYLGKTPQARAPPASVTADEPGVARYELKRKFFNKFAKSLPRARKGGPTQVDYELVRIITESTDGADCLFNFCTSVGWGVMHERLKRLEDDLNAVCLWKDDGVSCRPLGLCSIFTRSAERCIALQERDWAEQFCMLKISLSPDSTLVPRLHRPVASPHLRPSLLFSPAVPLLPCMHASSIFGWRSRARALGRSSLLPHSCSMSVKSWMES